MSIQQSVSDLGIEVEGLTLKVEKLTERVDSLEKFRVKLPGMSGGLGGFLSGIGSGIMKGISAVGKGLGKAVDSVSGVVKDVVNGAKDLVEKVIDKGSDLIDHGLDVVDHTQKNAFDTLKKPLIYGAIGLCVVLGLAVITKVYLQRKTTTRNSAEINLLFSSPLAKFDVNAPIQKKKRICEICATLLYVGGGGVANGVFCENLARKNPV